MVRNHKYFQLSSEKNPKLLRPFKRQTDLRKIILSYKIKHLFLSSIKYSLERRRWGCENPQQMFIKDSFVKLIASAILLSWHINNVCLLSVKQRSKWCPINIFSFVNKQIWGEGSRVYIHTLVRFSSSSITVSGKYPKPGSPRVFSMPADISLSIFKTQMVLQTNYCSNLIFRWRWQRQPFSSNPSLKIVCSEIEEETRREAVM